MENLEIKLPSISCHSTSSNLRQLSLRLEGLAETKELITSR